MESTINMKLSSFHLKPKNDLKFVDVHLRNWQKLRKPLN